VGSVSAGGGKGIFAGGSLYLNDPTSYIDVSGNSVATLGAFIRLHGTAEPTYANLAMVNGDFMPYTGNTFYLGRNDSTHPRAWKGLILHDQVNNMIYRISMENGVLTSTQF
jgi:hypothetical protein